MAGRQPDKKEHQHAVVQGPTLKEAIDEFEPPGKPVDKPLRMPLQDVYSITGVGTVPVGRIETGKMKVGDNVIIMPEGLTAEVKTIESHHVQQSEASCGDNIGVNLRGIGKGEIKRGSVMGPVSNPPSIAKAFRAQIIVVHHPTAIAAGYTPVLHAHTSQVAATISEIEAKLDPRTGQPTEEKPKSIKTGDSAIVIIRPLRPLCIETFKDFPELGRFALRDMGTTIAAGVVREVTEKGIAEKDKVVAKARPAGRISSTQLFFDNCSATEIHAHCPSPTVRSILRRVNTKYSVSTVSWKKSTNGDVCTS